MVCVFAVPTVTFPKLALPGVTVSAAWTALPLTGRTTLLPCELVTVTFPVTVSEAVGLKATFSVAFCPGAKVVGVDMPLIVTSFALTLICEMVTLELPLFVSVTLLELELPALTLPKLTAVGLADMVTVAAVPVPLKATTVGELGALLAMLTLPLSAPAVVGANRAENVVLCPAASVAGVFSPLALYPAPVTVSCAIVSAAVPVLVSVKLCDFVSPSTTLP